MDLVNSVTTILFLVVGQSHGWKINSHLIISANTNPLVGTEHPPVTSLGRIDYELLQLLAERMNFTYEIRPPKDILASGNQQKNGSWTGGMGQVQRKEVDLYISTGAISFDKHQVVDLSFPIAEDDTGIVIPFPRQQSKTALVITPFTEQVWITLAIFAALVSTILRLTSKKGTLQTWAMFSAATLTSQDFYIREKRSFVRVIAAYWMLPCIVLVYGYTAVFTSLLTVPRYKPLANSIQDVAAKGLRVHILKGASLDGHIMNAKKGPLKGLADQLRNHPEQKFEMEDVSQVLGLIGTHGAYLGRMALASSILVEDYDKFKQCRFTFAKEPFFSRYQSIFLQKHSPLTKAFDTQIMRLQQFGFIDEISNRVTSQSRWPCAIPDLNIRSKKDLRKFQLVDLSAAFVALVAGTVASLLVFAFELAAGKCKYIY